MVTASSPSTTSAATAATTTATTTVSVSTATTALWLVLLLLPDNFDDLFGHAQVFDLGLLVYDERAGLKPE